MGFGLDDLFKAPLQGASGAFDLLTNKSGRDSAAAAQKERYQSALQQLLEQQGLSRLFSSQALVQGARGLEDIRGGFAGARGRVRAGGATSAARAREAGNAATARTQNNLFNRGLTGTSVGRNVISRAEERATSSIADNDARLAQLEASLFAQEGSALAGQRNRIAQTNLNAGNLQGQGARDLVNLFSSVDDVAYNPLADIAKLAALFTGGGIG